jgi:hypothetical protein
MTRGSLADLLYKFKVLWAGILELGPCLACVQKTARRPIFTLGVQIPLQLHYAISLRPPIKPSNMASSCTEVSSKISALITALRPITRSRIRLHNGTAQRRCISQASPRQQYGASSAMDARQAEAAKKNTSTLLVQPRFIQTNG